MAATGAADPDEATGAFQVKLDYFLNYSERDALWAFVEKVTVEKLKRTRDSHYRVRLELEGLLDSAEATASQLLAQLRLRGSRKFSTSSEVKLRPYPIRLGLARADRLHSHFADPTPAVPMSHS